MTPSPVIRFETPAEASALITLCASQGQKSLDIFTQQLDPALFGQESLLQEISRIARRHRLSRVRLLIQDTKGLHSSQPLIQLSQKLPSKIHLRRLTEPTEAPTTGFCIADNQSMVFFNEESRYIGFYCQQASAEAKHALLEFQQLWQCYSEEDQELKALAL